MLGDDGWTQVRGTKHLAFEHPVHGGKVSVSVKWTGLRFGSNALKGVMGQAGWTKDDVRSLYFERRRADLQQ